MCLVFVLSVCACVTCRKAFLEFTYMPDATWVVDRRGVPIRQVSFPCIAAGRAAINFTLSVCDDAAAVWDPAQGKCTTGSVQTTKFQVLLCCYHVRADTLIGEDATVSRH